jgi:hypothetical protein
MSEQAPTGESKDDVGKTVFLQTVQLALAFCRPLSRDLLTEMHSAGVDAMEFARQHARERIKAGFEARN